MDTKYPYTGALKVLLKNQFEQAIVYIPQIWHADDLEALHKTRVGFRRLRTYLRILKPFTEKEIYHFLVRNSRQMGQTLGNVRDLDVFRLGLETYFSRTNPRRDFESWLWQPIFSQLYRQKFDHVVSGLKSSEFERFIGAFEKFCTNDSFGIKKIGNENEPQFPSIKEHAHKSLIKQMDKIHKSQALLSSRPEDSTFHKLRIDLKRFRYTLEFFTPLLAEHPTLALIGSLVELQDHLGTINDYSTAHQITYDLIRTKTEKFNNVINSVLIPYAATIAKEKIGLRNSFQLIWDKFMAKKPLILLEEAVEL